MEKSNKEGKKGFFTLIKESITQISSGCGPGCGCHMEKKEEKPESRENK